MNKELNDHQAFLQQKTCFVSLTGFNQIESALNKMVEQSIFLFNQENQNNHVNIIDE